MLFYRKNVEKAITVYILTHKKAASFPEAAQHDQYIKRYAQSPFSVSPTFEAFSYGTSHLAKSPPPQYHKDTKKE